MNIRSVKMNSDSLTNLPTPDNKMDSIRIFNL